MMNTYRKLTWELSDNNNRVKSQKQMSNAPNSNKNKKCEGVENEKLDNDGLWNYKAHSPIFHDEKLYLASPEYLNPNSRIWVVI